MPHTERRHICPCYNIGYDVVGSGVVDVVVDDVVVGSGVVDIVVDVVEELVAVFVNYNITFKW